jgi:hypothetical protein
MTIDKQMSILTQMKTSQDDASVMNILRKRGLTQ